MKTVIATVVALLALNTANAMYADQMVTVVKCGPKVLLPDLGMSVEVLQGGIAGITQLRVERYFLGHSKVETYMVRRTDDFHNRIGAPVIFEGQGVSLSINYTTAPLPHGGHYGVLTTRGPDDRTQREELSCANISNRY